MTDTQTTSSQAVRKTWGQHGKPLGGFEFYGTEVKTPAGVGRPVAKVVVEDGKLTLKGANGRQLKDTFAIATSTKFWAVVPEDAPRQAEPPKADPKEKTDPLGAVEITAPKGGDTTVAPKQGAIAKAIKDSGKSIQAISREHGLNPSQMRRLAADSVAKVDTVRAHVIAKALGKNLAELFDAPEDKAKAAAAAKAAAKAAADEAAAAAEDAEAAQAEADQAAEDAEGTQDQAPEGTETPAE